MTSTSPRDRLQTRKQPDAYTSSWSLTARLGVIAFRASWLVLCRWTPKPCNGWRLVVLRLFGASIEGKPFVASSCTIRIPWLLALHDKACLAPYSEVYNLGPITLRARSTVTQYVYLCAGTHDLSKKHLPLVVGPIDVGEDAFIGAKALVLPGVVIGEGAVVGAGSVVTKDVAPWSIVAGNPAKVIGERTLQD